MNYEAIFKISTALKERVEQAYLAAGGSGKGVYVGPLDDPDAAGARLILFLYRIVPNPTLRNREHVVAPASPPPARISHVNSLPLDLYYLLTVGNASGENQDLEQLKFLGSAMQALQHDPVLGGLALEHEAAHVSLDPLGNEEMSRIWALFPAANFRTSVAYLVSPVWLDPRAPDPAAAPVVDERLDAGHRSVELTP